MWIHFGQRLFPDNIKIFACKWYENTSNARAQHNEKIYKLCKIIYSTPHNIFPPNFEFYYFSRCSFHVGILFLLTRSKISLFCNLSIAYWFVVTNFFSDDGLGKWDRKLELIKYMFQIIQCLQYIYFMKKQSNITQSYKDYRASNNRSCNYRRLIPIISLNACFATIFSAIFLFWQMWTIE